MTIHRIRLSKMQKLLMYLLLRLSLYLVPLLVVGYTYISIEHPSLMEFKSKIMESVAGSLGGLGGGLVPDMAEPSAPIPSDVGLGVPSL